MEEDDESRLAAT